MDHNISFKKIIDSSDRIVFFGGAGVSTESGIPDFRSATGLYTTHDNDTYLPEYMLSHSCFAQQPKDFYDFYRHHMLYPDATPNAAHRALTKLEQQGKLTAIITQNIDGLHQASGSKNVIELHGSVHRNYCVACKAEYNLRFIVDAKGIPLCTICGAIIKPDVVLYEESLDQKNTEAAIASIEAAEVLIVGGTSLNVYPAAGLIHYYRGHHLILINKSVTNYDAMAECVMHESIGETLKALFV